MAVPLTRAAFMSTTVDACRLKRSGYAAAEYAMNWSQTAKEDGQ
jgi:hypothetical protein